MFEPISRNLQSMKVQSGQVMEGVSSQLHQTVGKGVVSAMNDSFQTWLNAHPTIDWTVNHPLWAAGVVLIAIFLLWGLLRAIAQFIEQVWVAILRSPLLLIQWFFGLSRSTYQRVIAAPKEMPVEPEPNLEHRLTDLLNRLETLQQEEADVLQEVKTLLTAELNAKKA